MENADLQITMVKCFLKSQSGVLFDNVSHTSTVSNLVKHVSIKDILSFFFFEYYILEYHSRLALGLYSLSQKLNFRIFFRNFRNCGEYFLPNIALQMLRKTSICFVISQFRKQIRILRRCKWLSRA